ncbi:MAG TPA: hypothetical protein VGS61_05930 [Acidimicrobiales bacterium]|nr:hypothetical protein [Acidimicrobiales bacterium]
MTDGARDGALIRAGLRLEAATLAWNVVGVIVLAFLAASAHSVALLGFGLDSLVEIGASVVVLWELRGVGAEREARALALIASAFVAISLYLAAQSTYALATEGRARHSPGGIAWTAATALVMFALAAGKSRVGRRLGRATLIHEATVTLVDGFLAASILAGLSLNATLSWWWADPAAALVIAGYGAVEARGIVVARRAAAA